MSGFAHIHSCATLAHRHTVTNWPLSMVLTDSTLNWPSLVIHVAISENHADRRNGHGQNYDYYKSK